VVYVTWYDNQIDGMMQVKSTDRGQSFSPPLPVALITGVNEPFEGQSFRNLSIPSTAIDKDGNIYIAAASAGGEGEPGCKPAPLVWYSFPQPASPPFHPPLSSSRYHARVVRGVSRARDRLSLD